MNRFHVHVNVSQLWQVTTYGAGAIEAIPEAAPAAAAKTCRGPSCCAPAQAA